MDVESDKNPFPESEFVKGSASEVAAAVAVAVAVGTMVKEDRLYGSDEEPKKSTSAPYEEGGAAVSCEKNYTISNLSIYHKFTILILKK